MIDVCLGCVIKRALSAPPPKAPGKAFWVKKTRLYERDASADMLELAELGREVKTQSHLVMSLSYSW